MSVVGLFGVVRKKNYELSEYVFQKLLRACSGFGTGESYVVNDYFRNL